jgi:hypothetical protein
MVDITIHGDRVTFRVEGLDQLWAFRSELVENPATTAAMLRDAIDRAQT